MEQAQEFGRKCKIRAMNAIIIQLARELNLPIATFDNELVQKVNEVRPFNYHQ